MSFCLLSAVLLSARKLKWCPDLAEISAHLLFGSRVEYRG